MRTRTISRVHSAKSNCSCRGSLPTSHVTNWSSCLGDNRGSEPRTSNRKRLHSPVGRHPQPPERRRPAHLERLRRILRMHPTPNRVDQIASNLLEIPSSHTPTRFLRHAEIIAQDSRASPVATFLFSTVRTKRPNYPF